MTYTYTPTGVCSRQIQIEISGDTVVKIKFIGGCAGNTQGIAHLAEGMKIDDIIKRLEGIRCGFKPTSCPDQLAKALKEVKEQL
ncbi:MAG: TIGR03905 family TSCPD domain-containing protein [Acutalibacteraceae bacterium]|nr:TIGR03905 family TSCPD domain-containing protein [Acutalibacteraceae bacterium]